MILEAKHLQQTENFTFMVLGKNVVEFSLRGMRAGEIYPQNKTAPIYWHNHIKAYRKDSDVTELQNIVRLAIERTEAERKELEDKRKSVSH